MSSHKVTQSCGCAKPRRRKLPTYGLLTSSRRGTWACSCNYLTDLLERCWTAVALLERGYAGDTELADAVLYEVERTRPADPLAESDANFHQSRYSTRAFIQECVEDVAAGVERCNRCPDPTRGPWPLLDGDAIETDLKRARQHLVAGDRGKAFRILKAQKERSAEFLIKGHGHVIHDPDLERAERELQYQWLTMEEIGYREESFHRAAGNRQWGLFE